MNAESTATPRLGNRAANALFVSETVSYLRGAGFPGAALDHASGLIRLTDPAAADQPETSWGIRARARRDLELSASTDAVQADAAAAGLRFSALVSRRYSAPIADAHVTLSLRDLGAILQRLEPAACTKPSARIRAGLPLDGTDWTPTPTLALVPSLDEEQD